MQPAGTTRTVSVVVKISKLCNLRCRYCYEFEELARPDRMSRADLWRMYTHLADYYAAADARDGERTCVMFVWHGGEPLLVEPDFYWQTLADQAEVFGDRVLRQNVVQTNLVTADDARVELLRDGFDGVGVSIDLFGGLRVNIGGRDVEGKVLDNMDRLRAEGINVGAITVLHRGNIAEVDRIFRFYERARMGFRVLPLFGGATEDQNRLYELSAQEIVGALCRLADLWLTSDRPVPVIPLREQIGALVRHLTSDGDDRAYYDKRTWCSALLVNTNGDCYTDGDPYGEPEWALGNVFTTPLDEIFAGSVFDRSVRDTEQRMAANCLECPFFGGCDGRRIGDERYNFYTYQHGLPVCQVERSMLTHLERRFRESGLIDAEGRLTVPLGTADQSEVVV